jgi:hypothetical protein
MKVSDMFPRKFVSGDDLDGKAYTVTIEEVRQEKLRMAGSAQEEQKHVLYLLGTRKGIILSRTLAEQIAEITGQADTKDWPGCKMIIVPVPMTVAGKKRVAIRARTLTPGVSDAAELKPDEQED